MKVKFVCKSCKNPCTLKMRSEKMNDEDICVPFQCPYGANAVWERVVE